MYQNWDLHPYVSITLLAKQFGFSFVPKPVKFFFVLQLLLALESIMLTYLFSLFYVTGECYKFLQRGWAKNSEKLEFRTLWQT